MEELQKLERAVWRRAFVLTGSKRGAGDVLASVWKVQPDLLRFGESRLLRLTVIEARQWNSRHGGYAGEDDLSIHRASETATQFARALSDLSPELREAYLLTRLLGMEDLEASHALGVAKAVISRNRQLADETMHARLGAELDSGEREWTAIVKNDPTSNELAEVRQARSSIRNKRKLVGLIQFVVFAIIVGVLIWIGFGMLSRQNNTTPVPAINPDPAPSANP